MRGKNTIKMMVLFLIIMNAYQLKAQTYLGVTTSNYDALHAARFNPASLNTSSMKWQINLVGVDLSISQNYLKAKSLISGWDDYRSNLTENLNGEEKSGYASAIIALPGFMFTNEKAGSFSLNFTARTYLTLKDVDEDFLSAFYNDADVPSSWPSPWKDDNVEAGMNGMVEASLGYARKVYERERHHLYGGFTLKVLTKQIGANANGTAEFIYTEGVDDQVSFGASDLTVQVSDLFDGVNGDFNYKTGFGGIGADIGFVYEFKPQRPGQALVGDNMAKSKKWKRERPDYILKAGFAIVDIGNVKYTPSSEYSRHFISDGTNVSAASITEDDLTYEDWDDVMNATGSFTVPTEDIKVKLPMSINMFVDAKITDFFYVNLSSQIGVGKSNISSGTVSEGSGFAITPRLETPAVAIYVPVSYTSAKGFGVGAVARFGQVTLGMSDITGFFTGDASSTSVHFGLSFGGVKKKTEKKNDIEEEEEDERYL